MKSLIYSSLKLFSKLNNCEPSVNKEFLSGSKQKLTKHLSATKEQHQLKDFQFPEEVITQDLKLKLYGVFHLDGTPSPYGNILTGSEGIFAALYHDKAGATWLVFFSSCGQLLFISTFKG